MLVLKTTPWISGRPITGRLAVRFPLSPLIDWWTEEGWQSTSGRCDWLPTAPVYMASLSMSVWPCACACVQHVPTWMGLMRRNNFICFPVHDNKSDFKKNSVLIFYTVRGAFIIISPLRRPTCVLPCRCDAPALLAHIYCCTEYFLSSRCPTSYPFNGFL